jgi:hypothetical protein
MGLNNLLRFKLQKILFSKNYLYCLFSFYLFINFSICQITTSEKSEKFLSLDILDDNVQHINLSPTTDPIFNIKEPITKDSFSVDLAKYFLDFASYGYCPPEKMKNNECCSGLINSENWKLLAADSIDFADYNYGILKNEEYNKIIFAFPGTRGIPQFMTEVLNSSGVINGIYTNEKIMDYFMDVYKILGEKVKLVIKNVIAEHEPLGYQFIFIGHSLGGSMASIIALDTIRKGDIKVTDNNPVLITYGQPRTGNDIFSNEIMKNIPVIFRVVRQGDLIATFPRCKKISGFDFSKLSSNLRENYKNLMSSSCSSVFEGSKFNKDFILNQDQIKLEEDNYYSWHIGGLRLFSNEMDNYYDCGLEYGDNNPDPMCQITISLSIKGHIEYFGKWVSRYCKTIG